MLRGPKLLATLATPNQLIQLTMCCSQAQLETAARPASKAAARRVWAAADKGNKAKLDATTATSSASALASAAGEATEAKATDAKKSWADEPIDPRYIGHELRRRAAVAKDKHERLMQEKRERLAAQEQATLEAETAVEELRLQRLRQTEEAQRLQGPFARPARDTSQKRRDAEAARRVAEDRPERGEETWVEVATARGRRPRSPSRAAKGRGKTKDKDRDATPTMGGTRDPVSDDDDTYDRTKGSGAKGPGKGKGYKGGWKPLLDRLGRVDVSYRGCPREFLSEGARPGENLRQGDINVRQEDIIRQVLPASEEDALAMASEMSYVQIPERGFINHRYGIQGQPDIPLCSGLPAMQC